MISPLKDKLRRILQSIRNGFKKNPKKLVIVLILVTIYYFLLPNQLFKDPYSTVILSKEGELIGAKIALDGQWRFPIQDSVPKKFEKCILTFEDEYFYYHPGFNPISIFKALQQNYEKGNIVRGGSSLTQQVVRLSRKGKNRSFAEKIIELLLATRLEFKYSKKEILAFYSAHAPFGGNVVGLEMASWRYFGTSSDQLSWAESATLAVLPNAPGLIYPGTNQSKLLQKRNKLLVKLKNKLIIDEQTYSLAITEALPKKPYDLNQLAPHLLEKITKKQRGYKIRTTIDYTLQSRVNLIAKNYYNNYKQNQVNNLAILVIDIENRNIISYVGNSPSDNNHQKDVDIIDAPRSTGSMLKPFLFASMLDEGEILSNTLIADIPIQISGFTPQNFELTNDGAVPAQEALSRSLNIPAVLMLQKHGIPSFYNLLQKFKLRDISNTSDHYGLSLILGGAESNLWDLCKTYAAFSSTLTYFNKSNGKYRSNEFAELNYNSDKFIDFGNESDQKTIIGAGSIWQTLNALKEVNRPSGDEAWKYYDSALKIAWKTGTSFGNRDAWAIGVNKKYVVGVWVGNATGEGRPSLTGVSSSGPILFDVFNLLPKQNWFATPLQDLNIADVCKQSGHLAKEDCPKFKQYISKKGNTTTICPYHITIHLDKNENYRVNSNCEDISTIQTKSWFVLPPIMEWYYKSNHFNYQSLPPFRSDCNGTSSPTMDFIYPKNNSKIYLTKGFDNEIQPVILKIAHSQAASKIYWYLNNRYIGTTNNFHEMAINPNPGIYYLTVIDDTGFEIRKKLEIIK